MEKGKNEHLLIVNKCSNNLIIENQNLKDELLKLKEKNFSDKEEAFNRGMENGKKNYNYEVQIHPYQEVFKNKKMFSSEEVIKVGYKYIFFINGLPCLSSHIEIFETISRKEINEEKVAELINKISDVTNLIPNGNIQLIGNLAEFGKKLLNQNK